jgi:hydrophobe/amphiphile efflux-3 (HAE3) family protein
MSRRLEVVVRAAARRPGRVLLVASLVAAVGALLALRLEPSAATDTLVGRGTDSFQATERLHRQFGDDAVAVLVRGDLKNLVLTANLGRLIGLEGCLSGNKPANAKPPGGPDSPCARLAELKPVQVVYGPGTFINSAVNEIATQLQAQIRGAQAQAQQAAAAAARQARGQGATPTQARQAAAAAAQAVTARFEQQLLQIATRYGLSVRAANPSIDNPDFVYSLVFDPSRGIYVPKARFAYLFPNTHSALIQVRLKPGLSDTERARAIALVREAVAMPQWRLNEASYLVSGAPVVVNDVTRSLSDSLHGLLIGGLLVMALVLPLVFRRRRYRMLPLAVALGAAGTVFGLMSLLGARLTLASIAVLPVLLGLGVDYAIQYQARLEEDGLNRAVRVALPTIGTAVLATVAGFAILLLSPVPMVRGFGLVLMGGVILSFLFALSAGTAALAALSRRRGQSRLAASMRGAGELLATLARPLRRPAAALGRGGRRVARGTTGAALRRPVLVLALGALLAVGGWVVDSKTEVVSDITALVPRDLPAVRDVLALQRETNVAGEVDVLVSADDLTDPKVVAWMRDYRTRLEKRFAYSSSNGCGQAELCPAVSFTDLFRTPQASSDQARIRALLDAVPQYFSQAVITPDRTSAVMSFGIKLLPLDRQEEVLDVMRSELHPPAGVTARLAGLPVLAAEANAKLTDPGRRLGTLLAGLLLVAVALLAVYRRWDRAWVPLVPIALATGWSALVLWALGVPLNPMSATLGALVIAISTEFAVLLVARFREERDGGFAVAEALERTYASTGTAVLASGVTAIAGFAVLAFSDVQMLKDFGRVTVVDLTVSLLGVLAVLPAVLALAERRRAPIAEPVAERRLVFSGGERSETG